MAIRITPQLVAALGLGAPQDPIDVSIIFPAYNEVEGVKASHDEISVVLDAAQLDYEMIFIDDGSTDESWTVIEQLAATNRFVHGIRFNRNYGKSAALHVGFKESRVATGVKVTRHSTFPRVSFAAISSRMICSSERRSSGMRVWN